MRLMSKALLLTAVLAVAACNNPNRFAAGGGAGQAGNGISSSQLGDVGDPTSIAYFNQAVGDRVFFATDQSTLSDEARATLSQQAQWLNKNNDYKAIIQGFTDERGTQEYNLALGARRANAVEEYLISQGVAANRLRTISYGKERPVATCANESCYSQNRRAVTVLSMGAGS